MCLAMLSMSLVYSFRGDLRVARARRDAEPVEDQPVAAPTRGGASTGVVDDMVG
jgi:hypothetical protein